VADHDPKFGIEGSAAEAIPSAVDGSVGFGWESDVISQNWMHAAPHCTTTTIPFAANANAVGPVWMRLGAQTPSPGRDGAPHGGSSTPGTALVVMQDDPTDGTTGNSAARLNGSLEAADHIVAALRANMSRIIVSLPRYAKIDAGAQLLHAIAAMYTGKAADQCKLDGSSKIDADLYLHDLNIVSKAIAATDVVITFDEPMPFLGMHGMSGTAALLGDLPAVQAQEKEREMSSLFHALTQAIDNSANGTANASNNGALSLLAGSNAPRRGTPPTSAAEVKELSRHDAAGSAGGAGFALLLAGARALPLAHALGAQWEVQNKVHEADLVVVYQDLLDSRTLNQTAAGLIAPLALREGIACIAITREQVMSTRELAAQGIASAYVLDDIKQLGSFSARLAKSWAPIRP